MRIAILVALAACGGGGASGGRDRACDKIRELCSKDLVTSACTDDLRDAKIDDKTLLCTNTATSCGEIAGCFAGGFASTFDRWAKQFDSGMRKRLDRDGSFEKGGAFDKAMDQATRDMERDMKRDTARQHDAQHEMDKIARDMKAEYERGTGALAACTEFTGDAATAKWTGCADRVRREVRCEEFMSNLRCDCLEDGVVRDSFRAVDPPLSVRTDAERVTLANCGHGFGRAAAP